MLKDQFNYRHFTDRPEDEDPKATEIKTAEEEEKIGQGFRAFLPTIEKNISDSTPSEGLCTHNGKYSHRIHLFCTFVLKYISV